MSHDTVPTGKRAERNRRAIVSAAREVFLREGFDAAMDSIAATAGVSKVTVYNHFRSKEELFTAVIGEAMGEAHAALAETRAALSGVSDAREALARVARSLVAGATTADRMALRNLVTGELHRFPGLGRAWQENGPGRSVEGMTAILRDLSGRGLLDVGDAELATIQFFGLVLYPHLIVGSFGASLDPDLTDRLIADGVGMFLDRYGYS